MWYNENIRILQDAAPWGAGRVAEEVQKVFEKIGWKEVPAGFLPPPDLPSEKAIKIGRLKCVAPSVVYLKAPVFKQMNAALGIYDIETSQAITDWIHDVRQAVDEIETAIGSAATIDQLTAISVEFDDVKSRAEQIAAQIGGE